MMNTCNIRNPLSASMKRIRGRERGRETARLTARRSHLVERNIVMKSCVTLPSSIKSISARMPGRSPFHLHYSTSSHLQFSTIG